MRLVDLRDQLGSILTNKKFIITLFATICFMLVALFTYKRYILDKVKPAYVPNAEFEQAPSVDTVDLYFFFTNWCPHCKTAKPVWQAFKDQMGSQKIKGLTLRFIEVDCEQDTATSDKFNVKGYPTIKLVKGGQVFDYDAKPDVATLREFVESSV